MKIQITTQEIEEAKKDGGARFRSYLLEKYKQSVFQSAMFAEAFNVAQGMYKEDGNIEKALSFLDIIMKTEYDTNNL